MITKIKQLADEAIALQNKNRMDEVLREISAMCDTDVIAVVDERIKSKTKELIDEGFKKDEIVAQSNFVKDAITTVKKLAKGGKK